jgi:hypothetical protein
MNLWVQIEGQRFSIFTILRRPHSQGRFSFQASNLLKKTRSEILPARREIKAALFAQSAERPKEGEEPAFLS